MKLILIILFAFSFSADWWAGNNNPNGKTGFLIIKPYFTAIPSNDSEVSRVRSTMFSMPFTDYMTIEYTRTTHETRENPCDDGDCYTNWDNGGSQSNGQAYMYFHLPLYKLWE